MRRYAYVGPKELREANKSAPLGIAIASVRDLRPFATGEPLTFVIDAMGALRVAPRRSEHVACAGGAEVLSAGELSAVVEGSGVRVVQVSNQSTGYCPEPESWDAVARALDAMRIPHPGHFTFEAIFRRCPSCSERNLVKDDWFHCAVCDAALPDHWNF